MEIVLEILAKMWLVAPRTGNPGSATDLGGILQRRLVPGPKIGFATNQGYHLFISTVN